MCRYTILLPSVDEIDDGVIDLIHRAYEAV